MAITAGRNAVSTVQGKQCATKLTAIVPMGVKAGGGLGGVTTSWVGEGKYSRESPCNSR